MIDLVRLLAQDEEGQYLDRKSLWHGPEGARTKRPKRQVRNQIAEYVAAFANADGGVLVLGVEDDGTPTGHGYEPGAVADMLRVPEERLRPPQPCGQELDHGGHRLLVFEVAPAESAVMVVGDGFPRRVDDEVILESEEAINAIKRRARVEGIELDVAPGARLGDLDLDRIQAAVHGAGLAETSPEVFLVERLLADRRGGELVLRRGALLLFARETRSIGHPNAGVRILRVRGRERLVGDRHNVHEEARIEGALPEVIERAHGVLRGLIRRSARLHDLFFREMPEYPEFAWQEALVNAVAHRDYRIQGRGVEVWLYEDRMEVSSPGELPAEVSLEQLRRREPVHLSRNPRLTRVLAELGLMRELGEGIARMYEEMERSLLRAPELLSEGGLFRVTLYNEPGFESPDPGWVRHVQGLPISPRQKRILIACPRGEFASAEYQRINQVDRDVAYRELSELRELGLIASTTGKRGKGARYAVVLRPAEGGELARRVRPREVIAGRMQRQGSIQNADWREVFGVDRREALATLAELAHSGVLVREGERRGSRYRPGPGWGAWVREGGADERHTV